jgi:purine-binding chemotaxis protein CheW
MTATRQYCTFAVGELRVGIEVERVREVLSEPDVTPVPMAPAGVLGLLNLRGEIVTVIDARRRLQVADGGGAPSGGAHVIVPTEGETISLLVDSEEEVAELDEAAIQPVPDTVNGEVRRLLTGIYELGSGPLLLVLDVDRGLSAN